MTQRADPWPDLGAVERVRVDDETTLRAWRSDDAAALAEAWRDPEIRRWLDPPGDDEDAAATWIEGWAVRSASGVALDLVIDVAGDVAGEVGFSSFDGRRRACLVGYWVGPGHRGSGLAARSLVAACGVVRDRVGVDALLARCHPDNVASQRTAERAGFTLLAADHDGHRVYVLR